MRYFTRGFMDGDLDDDEQALARTAYASRIEAILPRLPAPVASLAGLDLHDGCIESVVWEPACKRLQLSVVVWHPAGHQAVTLRYGAALLGKRRVQALHAVALDRETQILASEVDCDNDGTFSHRLLFWPRDELTIDFAELTCEVTGRPDGRVNLRPFFTQIDAPNLE